MRRYQSSLTSDTTYVPESSEELPSLVKVRLLAEMRWPPVVMKIDLATMLPTMSASALPSMSTVPFGA